jgi:hypothetical protein
MAVFSLFRGLLFVAAFCDAFQPPVNVRVSKALGMSTADVVDGSASVLKSTLKKPSKVLTVGLEYQDQGNLSARELCILSMQLRKVKVSAIWCRTVEALKEFSAEQESARGNFPGPCPVIYHGPVDQAGAAARAGASAIVLAAGEEIVVVEGGCEVVWKVSTIDQINNVLDKTGNSADGFWLDGDNFAELAEAVPKNSLIVASVDPMQPGGAEIEQGKDFKKLGCASVMIRRACVGDSEDLEYAQFLVGGLTSKASSEFKFTGLTGSTNGHFGGVQANGTVKWKRMEE